MFKGGGGDAIDREYNRRMAKIYEQQNQIGMAQYDFWRGGTTDAKGNFVPYTDDQGNPVFSYRDWESAQVQSNMELLPYQDRLQKMMLASETALTPVRMQTEAAQLKQAGLQAGLQTKSMEEYLKQMGITTEQMGLQTKSLQEGLAQQQLQTGFLKEKSGLASEYFQAAQNTPTKEELQGFATADVMQSQAQQAAGLKQQLGAAGVKGTSGRYTGALADVASAGVKALSQQRTMAGVQARQEKLGALSEAMKSQLA